MRWKILISSILCTHNNKSEQSIKWTTTISNSTIITAQNRANKRHSEIYSYVWWLQIAKYRKITGNLPAISLRMKIDTDKNLSKKYIFLIYENNIKENYCKIRNRIHELSSCKSNYHAYFLCPVFLNRVKGEIKRSLINKNYRPQDLF